MLEEHDSCEGWWNVSCVADERVKRRRSDDFTNFDFYCRICIEKYQEIWKTDSFIERRGPDVSKTHRFQALPGVEAFMRGCILHLRGQQTPQPMVDKDGNALLWNGEIFDGICVKPMENDTQILSSLLSTASSDEEILNILEQIQGPWSFIYWQSTKRQLWFGRDLYGRRSLLWHLPSSSSNVFTITSVAVGEVDYTEIPAVGIFSIDFSSMVPSPSKEEDGIQCVDSLLNLTLHPWLQCRWPDTHNLVSETSPEDLPTILKYSSCHVNVSISKRQILQSWIPPLNSEVSVDELHDCGDHNMAKNDEGLDDDLDALAERMKLILDIDSERKVLSERLIASLQAAVEKRINNLPRPSADSSTGTETNIGTTSDARIAVLFSGGLDSSVLAALVDRCLPVDEPIDLLNVAFEQPAPEPAANKDKQRQKPKNRKQSKVKKAFQSHTESTSIPSFSLEATSSEADMSSSNQEVLKRLSHISVSESDSASSNLGFQLSIIDPSIAPSTSKTEESKNSTIAPLNNTDINCGAFEHETRTCDNSNSNDFDPYDVPDRRTGRMAYHELCCMNLRRKWNFIEINVTQDELMQERKKRIRRLIYPLHTVLDDSIGCALWFAARGQGKIISDEAVTVSKAKVIICGMAADEQFAGYSRHRAHFNKFGPASLISQLEREIWRISQRNLGRDDRIISDHGKEARFPFLDEQFTSFVSEIPVYKRANLHLPRGIGEKLLLRLSAFSLGLRKTSCQAKRAIQFGSKIAKLDNAKEKGSDVCDRLL